MGWVWWVGGCGLNWNLHADYYICIKNNGDKFTIGERENKLEEVLRKKK